MSWQVRVPKNVRKRIRRFPHKDHGRILDAFHELGRDPWFGDIERIAGEEYMWRRRVGNYRIFYCVYIQTKVIEIQRIVRRTSATY